MGLMSSLFGGGGGIKPPWMEYDYSRGSAAGIGRRVGGTFLGNDSSGNPRFDYTNIDPTRTPAQANAPYDYSGINKAISGFSTPETPYNAYNFNYSKLPEQYGNQAYESGAKDVRREGAGNLQSIQQAVGTRRPGLLMKAGQQNQRNVGENLANLNSQIRLNEMNKNTDLGVQEQQANAAEGAKAYGMNADNTFRNLQALNDANKGKIATQSGITQQERDYQDKGLQQLIDMWTQLYQSRRGTKSSGGSGILGTVAKVASAAAPFVAA